MIKIQRHDADWQALSVYTNKTKTWQGEAVTPYEYERLNAIAHFSCANIQGKKSLDFSLYKSEAFKTILLSEAHEKCAYCESCNSASAAYDIEHFRPKGKAICLNGNKRSDGYYWLAADWDNLFIACQYCNRLNKHEGREVGKKTTTGKGVKFPLACEEKRAKTPDCQLDSEEEVRLLINPAKDNPKDHLIFDKKGVVLGRDEKGKVSIEVLGLDRNKLEDARRATLRDLNNLVEDIASDLSQWCQTRECDPHVKSRLFRNLPLLKQMLGRRGQYLGAKRDWVLSADQRGRIDFLNKFGIDLRGMVAGY